MFGLQLRRSSEAQYIRYQRRIYSCRYGLFPFEFEDENVIKSVKEIWYKFG